ncbi:sorting and assembly machinery component 50 homolog isoform X2 [Gordionus sp. m RMFG-2023]|uniref:sorting and assembly machinery component 50 homolog isoform X2 n=1 Tax=Gordionus sp. m RMFG-2023 TaxID=3053472 RepID=UPI0031FBF61E
MREFSMDPPLNGLSAKVKKVSISGIKYTKSDVLNKIISNLFIVNNFSELICKSLETRENLIKFGVFNSVDIKFANVNDHSSKYEVIFDVEERGPIGFGVNTLIGNYDNSLSSFLKIPNVMGRGENVNLNLSYNSQKFLGFNAGLAKPLFFKDLLCSNLSLNLFNNALDYTWSNLFKVEKGISLMLQNNLTKYLNYTLGFETCWRHASGRKEFTPFTIREQYGHSLKTSFKHSINIDTRDNLFLPTRGVFLKFQQEFARTGLLKIGANFVKTQCDFHYNVPLPPALLDTVIQFTLGSGIIVQSNYNAKSEANFRPVHLMDKFFLGGPLTFRGFTLGGLGPHAYGQALGIDSYWSSGIHAYTPLPFIKNNYKLFSHYLRIHSFANIGSIGNFIIPHLIGDDDIPNSSLTSLESPKNNGFTNNNNGDSLNNVWGQMHDNIRISVGTGLVLNFGNMARCEFNYTLYNKTGRTDKATK